MKKRFLIFGVCVLFSTACLAQSTADDPLTEDGNHMLAALQQDEPETLQGVYFAGYINGVNDTMSGVGVCSPDNATRRQIVDVVKQYLITHPATRNDPASLLAVRALSEAWPCSPKK